IEFPEAALTLLEGHRARAERRGELHRALEPPARDRERGRAATLKRLGGLLADFARAEQEDVRGLEAAKDIEREIDRDIGDAYLALGDRGMGAHRFRGLKTFLENTIQHRPGRAARLRGSIGLLHLTEDFRFAEKLRVEAGGHFE